MSKIFNKELAQKYLEYRQLNSMPKQWKYMELHNITTVDALHNDMYKVMQDFVKMIEEMVEETNAS